MASFFFDSSALVKRYVVEDGTDWVRERTDPQGEHEPYVALIAGAEVTAALAKQRRMNALSEADTDRASEAFRREFALLYHQVAISRRVVAQAMDLVERRPLRGYDAVQLAAALHLQQERAAAGLSALTFTSSDHTLNEAASDEGLSVVDPSRQP